METLLRQYTLSEFELEFGSIQMESLNDGVAITENGVEIALAKHLKAAIEINIIQWTRSYIKNFYANLFEYEEYDDNGYTIKKKRWVLFASDLKYSRTDNERYILYRWYNYKRISERNNYCDFYIQTEEDGEIKFFHIDSKTHIHAFINDNKAQTYVLETDKGKVFGKYKSDSFIGAFIKLMDYPTTSNDVYTFNFYLYMDGRFEKYSKNYVNPF